MTSTRRGKEIIKFWATLQKVMDDFWGGDIFSDSVDVHMYILKGILFFPAYVQFLTLFWLLTVTLLPS